MTDQTKAKVAVAADWTKKNAWKYFGAMFMEKKDGEQAVSLTRLLALVCFAMLLLLLSLPLRFQRLCFGHSGGFLVVKLLNL